MTKKRKPLSPFDRLKLEGYDIDQLRLAIERDGYTREDIAQLEMAVDSEPSVRRRQLLRRLAIAGAVVRQYRESRARNLGQSIQSKGMPLDICEMVAKRYFPDPDYLDKIDYVLKCYKRYGHHFFRDADELAFLNSLQRSDSPPLTVDPDRPRPGRRKKGVAQAPLMGGLLGIGRTKKK